MVEQSIHLCICICRMRWQLGCVRPSALEGRRICLTRYITIAMVDMMIWCPFFGTTTCLDDKGNPPFCFVFFFFVNSWGEVCTFKVQGKRRRSGKTNERDERDELQMLKWKMIECEKLGTLHFSVAYVNQSITIIFFFLLPLRKKKKKKEISRSLPYLVSECPSTFKDFFITLGMYTCTP